jgi:hypothetical protein
LPQKVFLRVVVKQVFVGFLVNILQSPCCWHVGLIVEEANTYIMLEILVLKVAQMHYLLGLLGYRPYVDFLQSSLVDHDHAAKAFGQCLQLEMSAPLAILSHGLEVVLEGTVLILV